MAKKKESAPVTTKQLYQALKQDILIKGDRVIDEIEIHDTTITIKAK